MKVNKANAFFFTSAVPWLTWWFHWLYFTWISSATVVVIILLRCYRLCWCLLQKTQAPRVLREKSISCRPALGVAAGSSAQLDVVCQSKPFFDSDRVCASHSVMMLIVPVNITFFWILEFPFVTINHHFFIAQSYHSMWWRVLPSLLNNVTVAAMLQWGTWVMSSVEVSILSQEIQSV